MRTLSIVFTKSKKTLAIGSGLIRWWTSKPYSHVARHIVLSGDIDMYYQANEGKVNYEVKEIFDTKHTVVRDYEIIVDDQCYKAISRACLQQAGKPYALWQNLGIVYVDIMSWVGKTVENPWKKGLNCSELVYRNVLKPMIPALNYAPDAIKPHQIEDIILQYFLPRKDGTWELRKF